ncbi:MAG: response regulator, partial [Alcaligenaceae bacterium]
HTFGCAADFLAFTGVQNTSCLVCDLQMPNMDGIELLAHLEFRGLRMPVIFISAYASPRLRKLVSDSMALCLIEKPIDAVELETWIARALEDQLAHGAGIPS